MKNKTSLTLLTGEVPDKTNLLEVKDENGEIIGWTHPEEVEKWKAFAVEIINESNSIVFGDIVRNFVGIETLT